MPFPYDQPQHLASHNHDDGEMNTLAECCSDMICQECGLELDSLATDNDDCDCLCHTFV